MTLPCIRPPPSQSSLRKHSAVISWRTSRGYPGTPKLERRGHQQANHRDSPAAAPWGIGTPQSAGGPCRPVQGGIPPLPHPGGGDPAPALCPPCRTDTAGGGPLQQRQPAGPCGQHLWYGGLLHGGGNDPAGTGCLEGYKGVVVANLRLAALRALSLEQNFPLLFPCPKQKKEVNIRLHQRHRCPPAGGGSGVCPQREEVQPPGECGKPPFHPGRGHEPGPHRTRPVPVRPGLHPGIPL